MCLIAFGGIGSTGILGAYEGYQVVCVELEAKFVKLAEQNFELHKDAWVEFGNPFPVILQGDSRKLSEILSCIDCPGVLQSGQYKILEKQNVSEAHRQGGIKTPLRESKIDSVTDSMALESIRQVCAPLDGSLQDKGQNVHRKRQCNVHTRESVRRIQNPQNQEIDVRSMQVPSKSGDSPQKSRPLRQRSEEPTSSMRILPHEPPQKNVVESKKGGIADTEKQRTNELESQVSLILSSPPYADKVAAQDIEFYKKKCIQTGRNPQSPHAKGISSYGSNPGNLGNLKSGDVDLVLSSPPYAETPIDQTHMTSNKRGDESDPNYRPSWKKKLKNGYADTKRPYGKSKENLGNLKSGDVDLVLSSPPYEGSGFGQSNKYSGNVVNLNQQVVSRNRPNNIAKGKKPRQIRYADQANDNLGNNKGDTFWSAAKIIVQQCYQILKPGGVAIWVVKSFVRKGKIVDFPGDWQRLCEAAGFKTVCIHHAMLVKETKHKTLFGHTEVKRTERKSFFRRLAESKGSPPIDYEVVLCMEKET